MRWRFPSQLLAIPLFRALVLVLVVVGIGLFSRPAQAFRFYFELGAGPTFLLNSTPLLGVGGLAFTAGYMTGAHFELTRSHSFFRVDLGAQARIAQGTTGNLFYGVRSIYPVLRLQMGSIFVGFGASLWQWTRQGDSPSLLFDYQTADGFLSYLGQAGWQYQITPLVHFIAEVSGQYFKKGTTAGPAPTIEVMGALRLFIGGPSTNVKEPRQYGDGVAPGKYKGWRYPFGSPKD